MVVRVSFNYLGASSMRWWTLKQLTGRCLSVLLCAGNRATRSRTTRVPGLWICGTGKVRAPSVGLTWVKPGTTRLARQASTRGLSGAGSFASQSCSGPTLPTPAQVHMSAAAHCWPANSLRLFATPNSTLTAPHPLPVTLLPLQYGTTTSTRSSPLAPTTGPAK